MSKKQKKQKKYNIKKIKKNKKSTTSKNKKKFRLIIQLQKNKSEKIFFLIFQFKIEFCYYKLIG